MAVRVATPGMAGVAQSTLNDIKIKYSSSCQGLSVITFWKSFFQAFSRDLLLSYIALLIALVSLLIGI